MPSDPTPPGALLPPGLPGPGAAARLGARLLACLPEKLLLFAGLTAGICLPYFGIQRLAPPVHRLPLLALDRAVPFEPAWTPVYLSVGLLVPLFPLLCTRREDLRRFARGLVALCVPHFLLFALFPVAGPRPESLPAGSAYGWLVSVDGVGNAFPSLHVGLTTFCLLFGWRSLGRRLAGRRSLAFAGLATAWGLAIGYATLATRQHQLLDLLAAVPLGALAHALAWRGAARPGLSRSSTPGTRRWSRWPRSSRAGTPSSPPATAAPAPSAARSSGRGSPR